MPTAADSALLASIGSGGLKPVPDTVTSEYIEVPVAVGLRLPVSRRFNVVTKLGFSVDFNTAAAVSRYTGEDFRFAFRDVEYAVFVGSGVQWSLSRWDVQADVRYSASLNSSSDPLTVSGSAADSKYRVWSVTLGTGLRL